jgi:integrase
MRQRQNASLKAICDDYTDSLKANARDPREQAKTRLAEVVDFLGSIAAKSLTPQDAEKLKARLLATPARGRKDPKDPAKELPRTPASVNRYLQDLRAAYNLARRNGKVEKNPVADVRLLRENNKRVREMSPEEEKAILAALEPSQRRFHTDLRPIVRFLTATGLRLDEACNLRWSDIDWTAGVATLRKTKAQKTQHIPLSSDAVAILRALGPAGGDAFVFSWPDGRAWTPGYVTHAFAKAVQKASVTDLHVHDTRHTFACRMLRAGVDIYTLSKLLRHASVIMSERYAHLSQADLKAAVERQKGAQY